MQRCVEVAPGSTTSSGMQYSSAAQSALEPHAVGFWIHETVVGGLGQVPEPGVTHAPVVWQQTSPGAQLAPPHTTGNTALQTVPPLPSSATQRSPPAPPPRAPESATESSVGIRQAVGSSTIPRITAAVRLIGSL